MSRIEYVITGPLHVNHRKPGDIVKRDELSDPDHLEAIGFITRTTKMKSNASDGVVESQTDSTSVDSATTTREIS